MDALPLVRAPRVLNMSALGLMPPNAIYVGRPTRWGSPYKIGRDGNRSEVIAKYAAWARTRAEDPLFLAPLAGRDLACWCDPLPCHGHVLLRLANDIRAAVTGGRYAPSTHAPNVLSPRQQTELLILLDRRGVGRLAHGAAIGYDRSIALCVTEHRPEIEVTAYPPDEALDGPLSIPSSLHRRNRRMLKSSRAQILIALPGGGGAANCLSEAMVMGLEVWEWVSNGRFSDTFEERSRRL